MFGSTEFKILYGDKSVMGMRDYLAGPDLARGAPVQVDDTNNDNLVPASGDAIGLLTQNATQDGPNFEQMSVGQLDLPVKVGYTPSVVTLHEGAELELEGPASVAYDNMTAQANADGKLCVPLLVTNGTGSMASCTAGNKDGDLISFKNGKFYIAQTGDWAHFKVLAALTPYTATWIRYRLVKVNGHKV